MACCRGPSKNVICRDNIRQQILHFLAELSFCNGSISSYRAVDDGPGLYAAVFDGIGAHVAHADGLISDVAAAYRAAADIAAAYGPTPDLTSCDVAIVAAHLYLICPDLSGKGPAAGGQVALTVHLEFASA